MIYSKKKIQHEMLSDLPRTALYQKAIETHKDAIKDKIVMDIGCGTGILSLFCAKAGAQKGFSFLLIQTRINNHTKKKN